jgi:uncharacterized membrane protein YbhN (UPF0104 family)
MIKLLRTGITVVIIWFIIDQLSISVDEFSQLDLQSWHPNVLMLLASCCVLFFGYVVSSLIWREIVQDITQIIMPPISSITVFLSANICRYIPGKIWQIGGLAYLAQTLGIPKSVSVFSAISGQIFALAAASILSFSAFLGSDSLLRLNPWAILFPILVGLVLAPYLLKWLVTKILTNRIDDTTIIPRGWNRFTLKWFSLYLLNWILYVFSFWIFCHSVGYHYSLLIVGPAFAAAYVLGYVAVFVPAGLGVREASLVLLLGSVMIPEEALLLAVLTRMWTTFVEIAPGIPLLMRQLRLKENSSS